MERLHAARSGRRTQPHSHLAVPHSLGTFPVTAALILLFLIVVLTHSWASDLTLVPQDVAGEMVPPEVHSPHVDIPTVNQLNTGTGT